MREFIATQRKEQKVPMTAIREALSAGPTEGPWEVDSIKNEGEYGNNGPDTHSGFQSFVLINEHGKSICDTSNSDLTEVEEEYDEDSHSAWDAVGKKNLEFIAACNPTAIRSLLADLDTLRQRAEKAEEDARRYAWLRDHMWSQALSKVYALPILWGVDYPGEAGKSMDAAIDAARAAIGGTP